VSRRGQIVLSDDELAAFLDEQRVLTCATLGRDGWPHLMPLWYTLRDGTVWAWTYGKSQKVVNLRRDPRCTLQIEAGDSYDQLRGVMFKAEARIHDDLDTVAEFGIELAERYGGGGGLPADAREALRRQAAKRVALEFVERGRATWDHRKLGGRY
jgi:PPOX class probable F420-dependent enzyme